MIELDASKQKINETVIGSGMPDASSQSLHWSLYWLQRIFLALLQVHSVLAITTCKA